MTSARTFALATAIACVALGGCDNSSKAPPATPAASQPSAATQASTQPAIVLTDAVVGNWTAAVGNLGQPGHSQMTLVIRADKSLSTSNKVTLADGKSVKENIASGVWRLDKDKVILTLQKSDDGAPIPVEDRQWTLAAGLDRQVFALKMVEPKGPIFHKK